jgi:hypothetical protein
VDCGDDGLVAVPDGVDVLGPGVELVEQVVDGRDGLLAVAISTSDVVPRGEGPPLPRKTSTRTASSASARLMASVSSPTSRSLRALSFSGRSSRRTAAPSMLSRSYSTVP